MNDYGHSLNCSIFPGDSAITVQRNVGCQELSLSELALETHLPLLARAVVATRIIEPAALGWERKACASERSASLALGLWVALNGHSPFLGTMSVLVLVQGLFYESCHHGPIL